MEDINTDLMEKLGLAEGDFYGQVALITGSASGIGEAAARALTFLGAKIIELERERARSEKLLLNILPREIAQTLQERSGTIA